MFYTYYQNNSGGIHEFNEEKGITKYVIIEAETYKKANEYAEKIGIYFNGIDDGIDCECCGDRWLKFFEDDKFGVNNIPKLFGEKIENYDFTELYTAFTRENIPTIYEACVHYLDGKKVWYGFSDNKKNQSMGTK